jgi:collagen type VII alpha
MRAVSKRMSWFVRPQGMVTLAVALLVGALLGLSGASAKSGASTSVVHACVAKADGTVAFIKVSRTCPKGETGVLLNATGKLGKQGKQGKTGKQGAVGATGPVGPTGPAGPANAEVVVGPAETVSGNDNAQHATGEVAVSTASCSSADNPVNDEAYGGGVNLVTYPHTQTKDIVEVQSSYPDEDTGPTGATGITGVTGPLGTPTPAGQPADAWTGEAVVDLLEPSGTDPDTAVIQTYAVCGP